MRKISMFQKAFILFSILGLAFAQTKRVHIISPWKENQEVFFTGIDNSWGTKKLAPIKDGGCSWLTYEFANAKPLASDKFKFRGYGFSHPNPTCARFKDNNILSIKDFNSGDSVYADVATCTGSYGWHQKKDPETGELSTEWEYSPFDPEAITSKEYLKDIGVHWRAGLRYKSNYFFSSDFSNGNDIWIIPHVEQEYYPNGLLDETLITEDITGSTIAEKYITGVKFPPTIYTDYDSLPENYKGEFNLCEDANHYTVYEDDLIPEIELYEALSITDRRKKANFSHTITSNVPVQSRDDVIRSGWFKKNYTYFDIKNEGLNGISTNVDVDYTVNIVGIQDKNIYERVITVEVIPVNDAPIFTNEFSYFQTERNTSFATIKLNETRGSVGRWVNDVDNLLSELSWEVVSVNPISSSFTSSQFTYSLDEINHTFDLAPPIDFHGIVEVTFKVRDHHQKSHNKENEGIVEKTVIFDVIQPGFEIVSKKMEMDANKGLLRGTFTTRKNLESISISRDRIYAQGLSTFLKDFSFKEIAKGGYNGQQYTPWAYEITFNSTAALYSTYLTSLSGSAYSLGAFSNWFEDRVNMDFNLWLVADGKKEKLEFNNVPIDLTLPISNIAIKQNPNNRPHSQILEWQFSEKLKELELSVFVENETSSLDERSPIWTANLATDPESLSGEQRFIWDGFHSGGLYDSRLYRYVLKATDLRDNIGYSESKLTTPSDVYTVSGKILGSTSTTLGTELSKYKVKLLSETGTVLQTINPVISGDHFTFTFNNVTNENYTVQVLRDDYSATPIQRDFTVFRKNITGLEFTMTADVAISPENVWVSQIEGTGDLKILAKTNTLINSEYPSEIVLNWVSGLPVAGKSNVCNTSSICTHTFALPDPSITVTKVPVTGGSSKEYWTFIISQEKILSDIVNASTTTDKYIKYSDNGGASGFEKNVRYLNSIIKTKNADYNNVGEFFREADWSYPTPIITDDGNTHYLFAGQNYTKPLLPKLAQFIIPTTKGGIIGLGYRPFASRNTKAEIFYFKGGTLGDTDKSKKEDISNWKVIANADPSNRSGFGSSRGHLTEYSLRATQWNYARYSIPNKKGEEFLHGYISDTDGGYEYAGRLAKTAKDATTNTKTKISWELDEDVFKDEYVTAWVYVSDVSDVDTELNNVGYNISKSANTSTTYRNTSISGTGWQKLFTTPKQITDFKNQIFKISNASGNGDLTLDLFLESKDLAISGVSLVACNNLFLCLGTKPSSSLKGKNIPQFGKFGKKFNWSVSKRNFEPDTPYDFKIVLSDDFNNVSDTLSINNVLTKDVLNDATVTIEQESANWKDLGNGVTTDEFGKQVLDSSGTALSVNVSGINFDDQNNLIGSSIKSNLLNKYGAIDPEFRDLDFKTSDIGHFQWGDVYLSPSASSTSQNIRLENGTHDPFPRNIYNDDGTVKSAITNRTSEFLSKELSYKKLAKNWHYQRYQHKQEYSYVDDELIVDHAYAAPYVAVDILKIPEFRTNNVKYDSNSFIDLKYIYPVGFEDKIVIDSTEETYQECGLHFGTKIVTKKRRRWVYYVYYETVTWQEEVKTTEYKCESVTKMVYFDRSVNDYEKPIYWQQNIYPYYFKWPIEENFTQKAKVVQDFRPIPKLSVETSEAKDHALFVDLSDLNIGRIGDAADPDGSASDLIRKQPYGDLFVKYIPGSKCEPFTVVQIPFANRFKPNEDNWILMRPSVEGSVKHSEGEKQAYTNDQGIAKEVHPVWLDDDTMAMRGYPKIEPHYNRPHDAPFVSMSISLADSELSQLEGSEIPDSEKYQVWVLPYTGNSESHNEVVITANLDFSTSTNIRSPNYTNVSDLAWIKGPKVSFTESNRNSKGKHSIDVFQMESGVAIYGLALKKIGLGGNTAPVVNQSGVNKISRWGNTGYEGSFWAKDLKENTKYNFSITAQDHFGNSSEVFVHSDSTISLFKPLPEMKIFLPTQDENGFIKDGKLPFTISPEFLPEVDNDEINSLEIEFNKEDGAIKTAIPYSLTKVTGADVWTLKSDTELDNWPGTVLSKTKSYRIFVRAVSKDGRKGNWTTLQFGVLNPSNDPLVISDVNKTYKGPNDLVTFDYLNGVEHPQNVGTYIGNFKIDFDQTDKKLIGKNQKLHYEDAVISLGGTTQNPTISGLSEGRFVAYQCNDFGKSCEVIDNLDYNYGRYKLKLLTDSMHYNEDETDVVKLGNIEVLSSRETPGGYIIDDIGRLVGVENVLFSTTGIFNDFLAQKDRFYLKDLLYWVKGTDAYDIESCRTTFKYHPAEGDELEKYSVYTEGGCYKDDPKSEEEAYNHGPYLVFSLKEAGTNAGVSTFAQVILGTGEDQTVTDVTWQRFEETLNRPMEIFYTATDPKYTFTGEYKVEYLLPEAPARFFYYGGWKLRMQEFTFDNDGVTIDKMDVFLPEGKFDGSDKTDGYGARIPTFSGTKIHGKENINQGHLHMFGPSRSANSDEIFTTLYEDGSEIKYGFDSEYGWLFSGNAKGGEFTLLPKDSEAGLSSSTKARIPFNTKATAGNTSVWHTVTGNSYTTDPTYTVSDFEIKSMGIASAVAAGTFAIEIGTPSSLDKFNMEGTLNLNWNDHDFVIDIDHSSASNPGTFWYTPFVAGSESATNKTGAKFTNAAIKFDSRLNLVSIEGQSDVAFSNHLVKNPFLNRAINAKSIGAKLSALGNDLRITLEEPYVALSLPAIGLKLSDYSKLNSMVLNADGELTYIDGDVPIHSKLTIPRYKNVGSLGVSRLNLTYDNLSKNLVIQGRASLTLGSDFKTTGLEGEVVDLDYFRFDYKTGEDIKLIEIQASAFKMPRTFGISPEDFGLTKDFPNYQKDYVRVSSGADALNLSYTEDDGFTLQLNDWSLKVTDDFVVEGLRGTTFHLKELKYNSEDGFQKVDGSVNRYFDKLVVFPGFSFEGASVSIINDDAVADATTLNKGGKFSIDFTGITIGDSLYQTCNGENNVTFDFSGGLSADLSVKIDHKIPLLKAEGSADNAEDGNRIWLDDVCLTAGINTRKSMAGLEFKVKAEIGVVAKGNANEVMVLSDRYGAADADAKAKLSIIGNVSIVKDSERSSKGLFGFGFQFNSLFILDEKVDDGLPYDLGLVKMGVDSWIISIGKGENKLLGITYNESSANGLGLYAAISPRFEINQFDCKGTFGADVSLNLELGGGFNANWDIDPSQADLSCKVADFNVHLKDMRFNSKGLRQSEFLKVDLSRKVSSMIGADGKVTLEFVNFRWTPLEDIEPKWDKLVIHNYTQDFHIEVVNMELLGTVDFAELFRTNPGIVIKDIAFATGPYFGNTKIPTGFGVRIDGKSPYLHPFGNLPRKIRLAIPEMSLTDDIKGKVAMEFGFKELDDELFFTGEGVMSIPGFAEPMKVRVSWVEPSKINKSGIEEAFLHITLSKGQRIPLGTTGLYITGLEGGIYDGRGQPKSAKQCVSEGLPPGMKADIAMYVEDAGNGDLAQGRLGAWVQFNQIAFGVDGKLKLIKGKGDAGLCAAITNNGKVFRAKASVTANAGITIKGSFGVNIWSHKGKKYLSGYANAELSLKKGSLYKKWWIKIPPGSMSLGSFFTQFGAFQASKSGFTAGIRFWGKSYGVGLLNGSFVKGNMNKYKIAEPPPSNGGQLVDVIDESAFESKWRDTKIDVLGGEEITVVVGGSAAEWNKNMLVKVVPTGQNFQTDGIIVLNSVNSPTVTVSRNYVYGSFVVKDLTDATGANLTGRVMVKVGLFNEAVPNKNCGDGSYYENCGKASDQKAQVIVFAGLTEPTIVSSSFTEVNNRYFLSAEINNFKNLATLSYKDGSGFVMKQGMSPKIYLVPSLQDGAMINSEKSLLTAQDEGVGSLIELEKHSDPNFDELPNFPITISSAASQGCLNYDEEAMKLILNNCELDLSRRSNGNYKIKLGVSSLDYLDAEGNPQTDPLEMMGILEDVLFDENTIANVTINNPIVAVQKPSIFGVVAGTNADDIDKLLFQWEEDDENNPSVDGFKILWQGVSESPQGTFTNVGKEYHQFIGRHHSYSLKFLNSSTYATQKTILEDGTTSEEVAGYISNYTPNNLIPTFTTSNTAIEKLDLIATEGLFETSYRLGLAPVRLVRDIENNNEASMVELTTPIWSDVISLNQNVTLPAGSEDFNKLKLSLFDFYNNKPGYNPVNINAGSIHKIGLEIGVDNFQDDVSLSVEERKQPYFFGEMSVELISIPGSSTQANFSEIQKLTLPRVSVSASNFRIKPDSKGDLKFDLGIRPIERDVECSDLLRSLPKYQKETITHYYYSQLNSVRPIDPSGPENSTAETQPALPTITPESVGFSDGVDEDNDGIVEYYLGYSGVVPEDGRVFSDNSDLIPAYIVYTETFKQLVLVNNLPVPELDDDGKLIYENEQLDEDCTSLADVTGSVSQDGNVLRTRTPVGKYTARLFINNFAHHNQAPSPWVQGQSDHSFYKDIDFTVVPPKPRIIGIFRDYSTDIEFENNQEVETIVHNNPSYLEVLVDKAIVLEGIKSESNSQSFELWAKTDGNKNILLKRIDANNINDLIPIERSLQDRGFDDQTIEQGTGEQQTLYKVRIDLDQNFFTAIEGITQVIDEPKFLSIFAVNKEDGYFSDEELYSTKIDYIRRPEKWACRDLSSSRSSDEDIQNREMNFAGVYPKRPSRNLDFVLAFNENYFTNANDWELKMTTPNGQEYPNIPKRVRSHGVISNFNAIYRSQGLGVENIEIGGTYKFTLKLKSTAMLNGTKTNCSNEKVVTVIPQEETAYKIIPDGLNRFKVSGLKQGDRVDYHFGYKSSYSFAQKLRGIPYFYNSVTGEGEYVNVPHTMLVSVRIRPAHDLENDIQVLHWESLVEEEIHVSTLNLSQQILDVFPINSAENAAFGDAFYIHPSKSIYPKIATSTEYMCKVNSGDSFPCPIYPQPFVIGPDDKGVLHIIPVTTYHGFEVLNEDAFGHPVYNYIEKVVESPTRSIRLNLEEKEIFEAVEIDCLPEGYPYYLKISEADFPNWDDIYSNGIQAFDHNNQIIASELEFATSNVVAGNYAGVWVAFPKKNEDSELCQIKIDIGSKLVSSNLNVWNKNYSHVYHHAGDDVSQLLESTSSQRHAVKDLATTRELGGLIKTSNYTNGTSSVINVTNDWANPSNPGYSFSGWVKVNDLGSLDASGSYLLKHEDSQNNDLFAWKLNQNGSMDITIRHMNINTPAGLIFDSEWMHLALTIDWANNRQVKIYINGAVAYSQTLKDGVYFWDENQDLSLSHFDPTSNISLLDEFRISPKVIDPLWYSLDYVIQNPDSKFGKNEDCVVDIDIPEHLKRNFNLHCDVQIGDRGYLDRALEFTNLPEKLKGGVLMQSKNNDFALYKSPYAIWGLPQNPVNAYILIDSRYNKLPGFLEQGWVKQTETVTLSNGDIMTVWYKNYSIGKTYSLPSARYGTPELDTDGNIIRKVDGNKLNYLLVFQPYSAVEENFCGEVEFDQIVYTDRTWKISSYSEGLKGFKVFCTNQDDYTSENNSQYTLRLYRSGYVYVGLPVQQSGVPSFIENGWAKTQFQFALENQATKEFEVYRKFFDVGSHSFAGARNGEVVDNTVNYTIMYSRAIHHNHPQDINTVPESGNIEPSELELVGVDPNIVGTQVEFPCLDVPGEYAPLKVYGPARVYVAYPENYKASFSYLQNLGWRLSDTYIMTADQSKPLKVFTFEVRNAEEVLMLPCASLEFGLGNPNYPLVAIEALQNEIIGYQLEDVTLQVNAENKISSNSWVIDDLDFAYAQGTVSNQNFTMDVHAYAALHYGRTERFVLTGESLESNKLVQIHQDDIHVGQSFRLADLMPDFSMATNVSVNAQNLIIDGSVQIGFINNSAIAIEDEFSIVVFEDLNGNFSFDVNVDTYLGETQISGLKANTAHNENILVNGGISFPEKTILAFLDADNWVEESKELNNIMEIDPIQCSSVHNTFVHSYDWMSNAQLEPTIPMGITPLFTYLGDTDGNQLIDASDEKIALYIYGYNLFAKRLDGSNYFNPIALTTTNASLTVQDLDYNLVPEIIVGNAVYSINGDEIFKIPSMNSSTEFDFNKDAIVDPIVTNSTCRQINNGLNGNELFANTESCKELENSIFGEELPALISGSTEGSNCFDLSVSYPRFVQGITTDPNMMVVRIANVSNTTISAGLKINVYDGDPLSGASIIAEVLTPNKLAQGIYEDITIPGPFITDQNIKYFIVLESGKYFETNLENNSIQKLVGE